MKFKDVFVFDGDFKEKLIGVDDGSSIEDIADDTAYLYEYGYIKDINIEPLNSFSLGRLSFLNEESVQEYLKTLAYSSKCIKNLKDDEIYKFSKIRIENEERMLN